MHQTIRTPLTFVAAILLSGMLFSQGPYKLIKKIPAVGDSGWDYLTLDAQMRRLYIAHGTRVNILNVDTHKTMGTIPGTPGVHGVAIATPFGRGFITQSKTNSVAIFDLKSLEKIGETPTQDQPDAILFDPASQHVFAFNSLSNSATVIDPQNMESINTVALSGRPDFAVSDGKGRLFVNLRDQNSVAQINSHALKVEKSIPVSSCQQPTSLDIDIAHDRLFVGCANKVMAVVDITKGTTISTLPIGDRVDSTLYDSGTGLIFNSNNDGTVTVIKQDSPDKYHVQEIISTQVGARTAAFDSKTNTLFLAVADFGPLPTPTANNPRPKQKILPNTFNILVVGQ